MTRADYNRLMENASPAVKSAATLAMAEASRPKASGFFDRDYTPPLQTLHEKPKQKPAIRVPKASVPGKAEADYYIVLCDEFADRRGCVVYEAITFRLRSGARYCPDWTVWSGGELLLVCEVKGIVARHHSSARSILAFKTAASEWPAIIFRYAAKQRDGSWNITELNKP